MREPTVVIHFDPGVDGVGMRLATEYWWSCECGQSSPKGTELVVVGGSAIEHSRSCRYIDGRPPPVGDGTVYE